MEIFRKSGTLSHFHADSAVVYHDDVSYIVVAIDSVPEAKQGFVRGIQIVDDVMMERARKAKSAGDKQQ